MALIFCSQEDFDSLTTKHNEAEGKVLRLRQTIEDQAQEIRRLRKLCSDVMHVHSKCNEEKRSTLESETKGLHRKLEEGMHASQMCNCFIGHLCGENRQRHFTPQKIGEAQLHTASCNMAFTVVCRRFFGLPCVTSNSFMKIDVGSPVTAPWIILLLVLRTYSFSIIITNATTTTTTVVVAVVVFASVFVHRRGQAKHPCILSFLAHGSIRSHSVSPSYYDCIFITLVVLW